MMQLELKIRAGRKKEKKKRSSLRLEMFFFARVWEMFIWVFNFTIPPYKFRICCPWVDFINNLRATFALISFCKKNTNQTVSTEKLRKTLLYKKNLLVKCGEIDTLGLISSKFVRAKHCAPAKPHLANKVWGNRPLVLAVEADKKIESLQWMTK